VSEDHPALEFKLRADGLELGQGSYWTGCGEKEEPASGEAFQSHCNGINWARRWNHAQMTRNGKKCKVRRLRHAPACEEFVVNFSPWEMKFLNSELVRWEAAGISPDRRSEMLAALTGELRREVVTEFRVTQRDVVASYIHWDSNKIHIGVIHSRVGPANDLVGQKRLGTVGPWSTAQNRLSKLGLLDAGDQRLKDNLDRFRTRFGADRQPLDIALHDLLDDKFSGLVDAMGDGAQDRFAEAVDYYKAWKLKARREAVFRTPSSQAIARTCIQAFEIVSASIDALSPPAAPVSTKNLQPQLAIR
jgi:hypothetical protein